MKNTATISRRSLMAAVPLIMCAGAATAASDSSLMVQRLNWSGVRLRTGNIDLLIDASSSENTPAPLEPAASRTFALATHHHGDHLDIGLLQGELGDRGYLVIHHDVAALIDLRAVKVQTVDLYEPVFFSRGSGAFAAWCVPASDGFGDPQTSWIVDGGGRRIIHCGDTLWHGNWWKIARAYGPFDLAFVPINGARQIGGLITDVQRPMMMEPEEAAAAAAALGAKRAVPIHYGFSAPNYLEQDNPEERFINAAKKHGVKTKVMRSGETMSL
ncbi:MAG: MBL fold metallo-hydrolase [Pseudomonadota bacterium]